MYPCIVSTVNDLSTWSNMNVATASESLMSLIRFFVSTHSLTHIMINFVVDAETTGPT